MAVWTRQKKNEHSYLLVVYDPLVAPLFKIGTWKYCFFYVNVEEEKLKKPEKNPLSYVENMQSPTWRELCGKYSSSLLCHIHARYVLLQCSTIVPAVPLVDDQE
jgi:hypothetical protein